MSRIGKNPVTVPKEAKVEINERIISVEGPKGKLTREIPAGFIGKPYGEYSRFSASNGNDILIGLLENTGTIYEMKRLSLREAQKTADMAQLVENLKKTKNLVGNLPNINPPAAYILPENSMAIFVTGRSLHGQKNQ